MTMRFKPLALIPFLALSLFAFADDDAVVQEEQEHVTVRSRALDERMKERLRESRSKELEEASQTPSATSATVVEAPLFQLASASWQEPQVFFASMLGFPINTHMLIGIADDGRSLEIEDGSFWEISPSDGYVMNGWRRNDQLVIMPDYGWFSPYDYFIINKSDGGSTVHANLWVGPIQYGAQSHWIIDIDPIGGHVRLENDMIWCIDPKDSNVLRSWAINDHIIFGTYDSWFSPYTHILINVNMDEHVKARQY